MRALLTGANGQLGRALQACVPAQAELIALGREELDLADRHAIETAVLRHRPSLIINAAAYTAVDRAESEEATAALVNTAAVGELATVAAAIGARLIHISTDFVFDGSCGKPYSPDAPTHPLGAYGRTKLGGELLAGDDALIVRTSWLYSVNGPNFVMTILRLMASKPEIRVVCDQVGSPTYAPGLAAAIWDLAESDTKGIFHFADAGVASWYDFAVAIQEEALLLGLPNQATAIQPIKTEDYPTPARRPAFSVLDCSATWQILGRTPPHWRTNLRNMLRDWTCNG